MRTSVRVLSAAFFAHHCTVSGTVGSEGGECRLERRNVPFAEFLHLLQSFSSPSSLRDLGRGRNEEGLLSGQLFVSAARPLFISPQLRSLLGDWPAILTGHGVVLSCGLPSDSLTSSLVKEFVVPHAVMLILTGLSLDGTGGVLRLRHCKQTSKWKCFLYRKGCY